MKWLTWKKHQGVREMGSNKYNPEPPWDMWVRIMGVVARCEGNHDTVVSYDGTGVTWGFLQWTFTSGRLQKLLYHMQKLDIYKDFALWNTVFDYAFVLPYTDEMHGRQIFQKFGFKVENGKFFDIYENPPKHLNPSIHKKLIDDICMGRGKYYNPIFENSKKQAMALAKVFSDAGKIKDVADAQIAFAVKEFQGALRVRRGGPLGKVGTIEKLLENTWETPLPAIFFNLWQNSPKYAYKLFLKEYKSTQCGEDYFMKVWNRLKRSKFGNWSYAKSKNTSPRIKRIRDALKEFYRVDLPVR